MKTSEGWDLLSIGEISAEKIQKNLREISVFLSNDIRNIRDIVFQYHPLEVVKFAFWEQHRLLRKKNSDLFALQVASRLVAYLSSLLPYWEKDYSLNTDIKPKDWKRVSQLFEDLCKKSIRYADNYTLLLRSQGLFGSDDEMLLFQEEASDFCLPPVAEEDLLQQKLTALQYQLQPFNALVNQVFPAKLDGLLSAFLQLSKRAFEGIDSLLEDNTTFKQASMLQLEVLKSRGERIDDLEAVMNRIIKEQGWESWVESIVDRRDKFLLFDVLVDTSLNERDAYLLSDAFASRDYDDSSHLLIDGLDSDEIPFVRVDASYYCFVGHSLLDKAYGYIKRAVCSQDEKLAREWNSIEADKQTLVPVTFFTAMLGTFNYTSNVDYQDGYLDALYENDEKQVVVQVPSSHGENVAENPFHDSEQYVQNLQKTIAAGKLAQAHPTISVLIDTKHPTLYPLEVHEGVLRLSFLQLANLASSWEGVSELKELLGLSPFVGVHHHDNEEEETVLP
ncbi:hypothetical protein, partial [Sphaerochaeta sp.]|uniref:hypothetical protein n=1 Tax=Sphaerochaeta sp. TaxID=1972642 RepID=UPI003D148B2B